MADGKFLIGKPAGGVTTVTVIDGATNTNLVLPESGTVSSVDTVVTDNAIARYDGITGKMQNSSVTIDDSGNLTTPSITIATDKAAIVHAANNMQFIGLNTDTIFGNSGAFSTKFYTNDSERMRIDSSGNLLIGATSLIGGTHTIFKGTGGFTAGDRHLTIAGLSDTVPGASFYYGNNTSAPNAISSVLKLGTMNVTNRSINAAGTINASGADYAEYEYSNDITLVKGQIVGFKADGTLTDKYSEAIRFAIKSTNPSIVGGDVWGAEDVVGKRPEQPVRKLDKTEQVPIKDSEEFETLVIEAGDTDSEWEAIEAQYKIDLADFEARLEVERQKFDRIAYAGKVPVNVYGAIAGQYIVAIEKDGGIDGLAVNKADMTFIQYQDAVGRVNKILDDGRAEVAVIIH